MGKSLDYHANPWDVRFSEASLDIVNRPLILLGPLSYLGCIYGPRIVPLCRNVVAVVDDQNREETVYGIARWDSDQFRARAPSIKNVLGVDLSCSPMGHAVFGRLLADTGVERVDLVRAIAEL